VFSQILKKAVIFTVFCVYLTVYCSTISSGKKNNNKKKLQLALIGSFMCTHFRCEHKICIMSKIMGNMHNPMLKCMLCNTNVIYLEQMKGVFEGRLVCVLTRSLRDHERARKRSWYHVSTIWKISIRSVSVKYKIQLARVAMSETSDKP